jgi:iodotyrosine deiodinase
MPVREWPFEPLRFETLPPEEMQRRALAFYERMRRRRSVRAFSDRPVPRDVIGNALRTAGSAPSGANMQPWHFVAVADPVLKARIREAAEAEEKAFYGRRASEEWLEALWLIAVFLKKFTIDDAGVKHKNYYPAESVGIACGFLLAALHWSGLATLTHTPSPMKFLAEVLGRPRNERAYMLIVTGFPAADATVPVIDKHPLERITTFVE